MKIMNTCFFLFQSGFLVSVAFIVLRGIGSLTKITLNPNQNAMPGNNDIINVCHVC